MQRDRIEMVADNNNGKDKTGTHGDERPAPNPLEGGFLDFQVAVANDAVKRLAESARKLEKGKGKSGKRVHNMRVAFRRWYSVWAVLSQEGFKSKAFKRKCGSELKKAYKLLGAVRDWDVNIATGKEFGVPETVLAKWELQRDRVKEETFGSLERLDLKRLVKKLAKYIKKRAEKLRHKRALEARYNARPRVAIEGYLVKTEEETRHLAMHAETLEELHALRLSIKAWRYILVDFYGYSCEPLVAAQQLLGLLNDLERVRVLLHKEDRSLVNQVIEDVVKRQQDIIDELETVEETLPFGIRPN